MIEVRELDEREATTVLETIGDTPVHGVFDTSLEADGVIGQLVCVTPTYGRADADRIAKALGA